MYTNGWVDVCQWVDAGWMVVTKMDGLLFKATNVGCKIGREEEGRACTDGRAGWSVGTGVSVGFDSNGFDQHTRSLVALMRLFVRV